MTPDTDVSEALRLATVELLARAGLGLELDGRVQVWADQVMDQMSDWPRQSDAIYVLEALPSPVHWGEVDQLLAQATTDLKLQRPKDEAESAIWLAGLHVAEILAAKGDDFTALKKLSRLWFDHEVDALKGFYLLKHAIRDVERHGTQPHWPGLTQENWRDLLCEHCVAWQKDHPSHNPFTPTAAR
ncbi:hypothetical protein MWU76_19285 [Gelidibacter sp. F2691]|nr:hypothetical protein [Gelidibacter sp. F2691]